MSNVLAGLGLQPDPESGATAPAQPEVPGHTHSVAVPEAEPAAPAPQAAATPDPDDDDIAVPEGAENPDAVRSLIKAERAAARQAYARARDAEAKLAAIEEAGKPVEERLALAQQRAEEASLEALRLRVGFKHGLDVTLAERLQGSDEESMTKDATSLLEALNKGKPAAPQIPGGLNGGPTPPPVQPTDPGLAHTNFLLSLTGRRPGA